jgi:hypothetical protein
MAFIYATAAAGVGFSAVSALTYYIYSHLSTSYALSLSDSKTEGRREILAELLRFGPRRLRRMCLEAGVRFSPRNQARADRFGNTGDED